MLKLLRLSFLVALGFFSLSALASAASRSEEFQPVNEYSIPYFGTKQLTVQDLKKAFALAGTELGYVVTKNNPDGLQLNLSLRAQSLDIAVAFNSSTYTISYVDSLNMEYTPGNPPKIHRKYREWMNKLVKNFSLILQQTE